jgi:hypothetical protein
MDDVLDCICNIHNSWNIYWYNNWILVCTMVIVMTHFNPPPLPPPPFQKNFVKFPTKILFVDLLQLISRNFGHANCEVGWEFGNYKHEIIKLIGNLPIKFGSFASNYRNSLWNSEPSSQASSQIANDFGGKF